MRKHPYIKRLLPLFLGVLFLFIHVFPVYSQSSLNACFSSAISAQQCASAGLISPQAAANSVRTAIVNPNPTNPFWSGVLPSKEAVALVGGVAALGYLTNQNMQTLQDKAISDAPVPFTGGQMVGETYAAQLRLTYPDGVIVIVGGTQSSNNSITGPVSASAALVRVGETSYNFQYGLSNINGIFFAQFDKSIVVTLIGFIKTSSGSDTGGNLQPSLSNAANSLPQSSIYAAAAAAAAAAARDAANRKDTSAAQTAAAAAAAAAGLVPVGSADKAAADGAAAAAAAAAADAADPTKAPTTPQAQPIAFSRTNFLAYAVSSQGFGNKFPFGMFALLPAGSAMICPSYTSWGKTVQLCFIRDIIMLIKYIVWVRFAIYSFVSL